MNPPASSISLLFAGELASVKFIDGSTASVRVRALPARHLNDYLDLRDVGREAQLLARVVQRPSPESQEADYPGWSAVDAHFVDNLDDESHAALIALADKLNFSRAISQAERQIATGTALRPLKERVAQTIMAPLEHTLRSLISSATTQQSLAAPAKQP